MQIHMAWFENENVESEIQGFQKRYVYLNKYTL